MQKEIEKAIAIFLMAIVIFSVMPPSIAAEEQETEEVSIAEETTTQQPEQQLPPTQPTIKQPKQRQAPKKVPTVALTSAAPPAYSPTGTAGAGMQLYPYNTVPLEKLLETQDFMLEITDYEPKVVRSDLLEERPVPVFAQLALVNINPIIETPIIRGVNIRQKEPNKYVSGITRIPPPDNINDMSNIGYAMIVLKQIPVEKEMPNTIEVKAEAEVIYDYEYMPGVREETKLLRPLTEEDWKASLPEYSFWNKAGYIRVLEIRGSLVRVQVYDGLLNPIGTFELSTDKPESQIFRLPQMTYTTYTGFGQAKLRLDRVEEPQTRAKLVINIDGKTQVNWLAQGEELYKGSDWIVKQVNPDTENIGARTGSILLRNKKTGEQAWLEIKALPTEIAIKIYDREREKALYEPLKTSREEIVRAARSQLGVPYKLGHEEPGQLFDCSGLAYYAYNEAGINLPRLTAHDYYQRFKANGPGKDTNKWQPGDMCFYDFAKGARPQGIIDHVGIYAGVKNGHHYIIDASSSRGKVVERPLYRSGLVGCYTGFSTQSSITAAAIKVPFPSLTGKAISSNLPGEEIRRVETVPTEIKGFTEEALSHDKTTDTYYRAFISTDKSTIKTYVYSGQENWASGVSHKVIFRKEGFQGSLALLGTKAQGYTQAVKFNEQGIETSRTDINIPYNDIFYNTYTINEVGELINTVTGQTYKKTLLAQATGTQDLEIKNSQDAYSRAKSEYWKVVENCPYVNITKGERNIILAVEALHEIWQLAAAFNDTNEQLKALRWMQEAYSKETALQHPELNIQEEIERLLEYDTSEASDTIRENSQILIVTLQEVRRPEAKWADITLNGEYTTVFNKGGFITANKDLWKISDFNSKEVTLENGNRTKITSKPYQPDKGLQIKFLGLKETPPRIKITTYKGETIEERLPKQALPQITIKANKYKTRIREADYLLGWYVREITQEHIIVEKDGRQRTIKIGSNPRFFLSEEFKTQSDQGMDLSVTKINIEHEAKISVVPYTLAGRSRTPFTLHIAIEKRLIKSSPEKMAERANKTRAIVDKIMKITDTLGDTIEIWKKGCFATTTALLLKNFVQGWKGKSAARARVMDKYKEFCADKVGYNKHYKSYHECFLEYSKQIEASSEDIFKAMERTDKLLKQIVKQNKKTGEVTTDKKELKDILKTEFGLTEEGLIKDIEQIEEYESQSGATIIGVTETKDLLFNLASKQGTSDNVLTEKFDESVEVIQTDYKSKAEDYKELLAEYKDFKTEMKQLGEEQGREIKKAIEAIQTDEELLFARFERDFRQKEKVGKTANIIIHSDEQAYAWIYDSQTKEKVWKPLESEEGTLGYVKKIEEGETFVEIFARQSCITLDKGYQVRYNSGGEWNGLPRIVPFPYGEGKITGEGYIEILEYDKSNNPISAYIRFPMKTQTRTTCVDYTYKQKSGVPSQYQAPTKIALDAVKEATRNKPRYEKDIEGREIWILGSRYTIGKEVVTRAEMQCEDFMSPQDCEILFQVCDPVMCPPSRCDFGGRWRVDDVVQTGVIGSIMLCLPNYPHPYVPICLPGIRAGLLNFASVLEAYASCLDEGARTGKTIGICDQIRSIYVCELLWREGLAIANAHGGLIDLISKKLFKEQNKGGGEYLRFKESANKLSESVKWFTSQYGAPVFAAFKARTGQEVGTYLCRAAFFGRLPGISGVFEELSKPESPPQFFAYFEEIPHTSVQAGFYSRPTSQYKIYFHIYAGEDKGIYYKVYLADPTQVPGREVPPYHIITEAAGRSSGFIPANSFVDESIDILATSGYRQLCVDIDGIPHCGFGKITSHFLPNYINDLYLKEQLEKDIKTAEECITGQPSLLPLTPALSVNPISGIPEAASGGLYKRGITRVCSSENPGIGTDPGRWARVGSCGKTDAREISCWLDTSSVENAITDLKWKDMTLQEAEEANLQWLGQEGFWLVEKSEQELKKAEALLKSQQYSQAILTAEQILDQSIDMTSQAQAHLVIARSYVEIAIPLKVKEDDERRKKEAAEAAERARLAAQRKIEVQEAPAAPEVEVPPAEEEVPAVIPGLKKIKEHHTIKEDGVAIVDKFVITLKKIAVSRGVTTAFFDIKIKEMFPEGVKFETLDCYSDAYVGGLGNNKELRMKQEGINWGLLGSPPDKRCKYIEFKNFEVKPDYVTTDIITQPIYGKFCTMQGAIGGQKVIYMCCGDCETKKPDCEITNKKSYFNIDNGNFEDCKVWLEGSMVVRRALGYKILESKADKFAYVPKEPVGECKVTKAYWGLPPPGPIKVGDTVNLKAEVNEACRGKTIEFEVRRKELFGIATTRITEIRVLATHISETQDGKLVAMAKWRIPEPVSLYFDVYVNYEKVGRSEVRTFTK